MLSRLHRYLLTFIVCASFCLFTSAAFSPPTQAATGNPITVTSQTNTVTFSKEIVFKLTATDSAAPIIQASIYASYNDTSNDNTVYTVAVAHSANTVTLQEHINISGSNFVTPGTQVTYCWMLHDKLLDDYSLPQQTFTVTDTRFSWQHLTQGQVQVNWYNRPTSFGQLVLTQAEGTVKRISSNLGGSLLHPVNVWIYQSNNDFHGSLPPGSYEWVGGIAFPNLNQASIVVETTADTTLIRDLPHELTHLIFHQLIGPNATDVPRWFDEGLAVYNQAYHEPDMQLTFKEALNSHSLLRLNTLSEDFPANTNKAYLAYAQSWNLLKYMYTTFGQPKMATLIKDIHADDHFDGDLSQALGMDQDHLENQWRLSLNQPATLIPGTVNPASLPHPIQVHVATNPYAPLLLTLGIILCVLPLIGLGGLFSYQRRSRPRPGLALQTPNSVNSILPTYPRPPLASPAPYIDPRRYVSQPAYQPYPAYPAPYPPRPLPNTPPPVQDNRVNGNMQAGDAWPPAYKPGQEYINRRPDNQAPQE